MKTIDIEKEYNKIMLKNEIDKIYPDYRLFLKALEILEHEYQSAIKSGRKINFVGTSRSQVNWFIDTICTEATIGYVYDATPSIENIVSEEVWVVSFDQREDIMNWLPEEARTVDIYDIFGQQGLFFERDFYDFIGETYYEFRTGKETTNWESCDLNHIFFDARISFEKENDTKKKKFWLEKIIFICAYAKDFVLLEKYLLEYEKIFGVNERLSTFQKEVNQLLLLIKTILSDKVGKDVIMLWLDGLEYGEDEDMPFLRSLDNDSVVFTNSYTVTPYTGPTFKTLFGKKRSVEENSYRINCINKSNSPFFQMLDKKNIDFYYFGELRLLEKNNTPQSHYTLYSLFSMMYWDCIRKMVSNVQHSKDCFCVVHELLHTHVPYISMGIEGSEYTFREAWPGRQDDVVLQEKQACESRVYVDRILAFWSKIISPNTFKIYMSDHGHTNLGRFHTIMKIQQEALNPCVVEDLFSYFDFDCMIKNMLEGKKLLSEIDNKEYLLIQDVPYYNKDYILSYTRDEKYTNDGLMGYQGIVTLDEIFIRHNDGVELYQKRFNDNKMVTDSRLDWLRDHISKKAVDIYGEEKFKYSRILVSAEEKCLERSSDIENKKNDIIRKLFSDIERTDCLAIRGGGMHTLRLLLLLPYELRRKVEYIIDNDPNCLAGRLGIKVIPSNACNNTTINTVLISSYDYKDVWMEEMKQKGIARVINLYDEFEKVGILWNREFYKKKYIRSDFEYCT